MRLYNGGIIHSPDSPAITGTTTMTLTEGYAATSTGAYLVTGTPAPTVIKTSGNAAITWNDTAKTLDIAAGLPAGSYPVVLTASNNAGSVSLTFTLTVNTSGNRGGSGGCSTGFGTLGALVLIAALIGRRRR